VRSWGISGYGDFWIHMLVAEAATEASVKIEAAIWDSAALTIVVEEAGGRLPICMAPKLRMVVNPTRLSAAQHLRC